MRIFLVFIFSAFIISCGTVKQTQQSKLYSLLGKLPERNRKIKVELVSREEKDDIIIERLMLDLNGLEKVPAYFTKPKKRHRQTPGCSIQPLPFWPI